MTTNLRDAFPGFDNLYVLQPAAGSAVVRLSSDLTPDILRTLIRGKKSTTSEPVRCRQAKGRLWTPIVWAPIAPFAAPETFSALGLARVTGWSSYAAEIVPRDGLVRADYSGLAATGRCGSLDDAPITTVSTIGRAGQPVMYNKGIRFDPETWDGSDFFVPDGTAMIITTGAGRDAVQDYARRSTDFVSMSEWMILAY